MELTKEKAIEIAIELWTCMAETGGEKFDWPGWKKYGYMVATCPLCEYAEGKSSDDINDRDCFYCPYYKVFGYCTKTGAPYDKWEDVKTERTRKKYAGLFLAQLRQLETVNA